MVRKPPSRRRCAAVRAKAATGRRRVHALPLMLAAALALADGEAAMSAKPPPADPDNPSCPKALNWSTYREMRFTFARSQDQQQRILMAEGRIDADAATRLEAALKQYSPIDEIW